MSEYIKYCIKDVSYREKFTLDIFSVIKDDIFNYKKEKNNE